MTIDNRPTGRRSTRPVAGQPDAAMTFAVEDALAGDSEAIFDGGEHPIGCDPADFARFYIRHRDALAHRASRFLSDARDVDEVVQESFLRVFLALPELETDVQAQRFAHRVLVNLCIDRYRLERRRPHLIDLDRVDDDAVSESDEDPVLRSEDAAVVRAALALLTPEHRAALVKREIEEKSISAIAAEMGMPEHNVKHLLFRARRSLRRILIGTAVDPAVDLSLEQTIDLTRQRIVSAAQRVGPRGLTVIIVLVVLAGVLSGVSLARSSEAPRQAAIAPAVPSLEYDGPSLKPPAGSAPGTERHRDPGNGPSHGGASGSDRASDGPSRGSEPGSQPARDPDHVPVQPAPDRPSPRPTRPPVQPEEETFALSGLLTSSDASVNAPAASFVSPGRYRSSSTFTAATHAGDFHLNQSVTFGLEDQTWTVQQVDLNPVVPLGDVGVGYTAVDPSVDAERTADDGLVIEVVGEAVPLTTAADGSAPPVLDVRVELEYAADLITVTRERVSVELADDGRAGSDAPVQDPQRVNASPAPVGRVEAPAP